MTRWLVFAALLTSVLWIAGMREKTRADSLQSALWRLEGERDTLVQERDTYLASVDNLNALLIQAQERQPVCPEPEPVKPKRREAKRVTPVFPYAKSVQ